MLHYNETEWHGDTLKALKDKDRSVKFKRDQVLGASPWTKNIALDYYPQR